MKARTDKGTKGDPQTAITATTAATGQATGERTEERHKDIYEDYWDVYYKDVQRLRRELATRPAVGGEVGVLWLSFYDAFRERMVRDILDDIGADKGTTILDIGCGHTMFTRIYAQDECPKVTGVDIAENVLEYQRKAFPYMEFVQGNAQDLELDGNWDVVHAGEVVEHLFHPYRAMDRWCKYVEKKDGWMIITTPTPTLKVPSEQHVSFVSMADVARTLRNNGMELVRAHGIVPFMPFVANWILKMGSVKSRDRVYEWYAHLPYKYPTLAAHAVYVGHKP